MELLQSFLVLGVCLIVYFMPAIIAHGKRNAGAIFALNLLLGWTVIGWIAALIWALCAEKK